MSKATLYKYVTGTTYTVTDEIYDSMGSTTFQLGTVKRAFKGGSNIVIMVGVTQLAEGIDYTLENEDQTYTNLEGFTVYTGLKLINATYYAEELSISYKALGSYTDPVSFEIFQEFCPIGASLVWESETLPANGFFQWREGASLVRANYPVLRDLYIVSRGAVTITEANPGVVTINSHGFGTGSCISLATTDTLPTNLAINTNYYVIYVNANTFRLATSADNARAGTAIDTTGAIQAGVHTLYSNPHGINGANSFYLPDGQGAVPQQVGDLTINGRTKTGVGLGAKQEDGGQKIEGEMARWSASHGFVQNGLGSLSGVFSQSSTATAAGPNGTAGAHRGINFSSADSTNSRQSITKFQENTMGVRMIVRVI